MPSVPGPHTGILREENIALRQIFGYRAIPNIHFPFQPSSNIQHLPGTQIKDLLLVAVDVDTGGGYDVISPGQSYHIGVSIFDTRLLVQKITDASLAIQSYQFINQETKPCVKATRRFHIRDTELIALYTFPDRFFELVGSRKYVLVGHGLSEDMKFLNNINPLIVTHAAYIIDTNKAAQHPLSLYYRHSLESLLQEFGINHSQLHAAGNDAHYVLKALLMIIVRDGRPGETYAFNNDMFATLEAIATADTPSQQVEVAENQEGIEKKVGLIEKGRLKKARRLARKEVAALASSTETNDDTDTDTDEDSTTLSLSLLSTLTISNSHST